MNISEFIKAENEKRLTQYTIVPEWNDAKVFYQKLSVEEYSKISKAIDKDNMTGMVDVIIMKAEYEDGSRMFTMADRANLNRYRNPGVITRLAGKILDTLTPEDAEKN